MKHVGHVIRTAGRRSIDRSHLVQYFRSLVRFNTMSLRRYFQPATTLPTASQTQLSPNVLQEVNQAVRAALQPKENGGRRASKRKYTTSFTPEDRARIGKYASENGNAAAVKKFKATHEIGESTVRLFKKKYMEEIKKRENPEDEVTTLPTLRRGRKVMLGEELDAKVKNYVLVLRNAGTPIGSSIVMAVGEGMVRAHDRTMLVQHGGHIQITKAWALSLLQRMGFVQSPVGTSLIPVWSRLMMRLSGMSRSFTILATCFRKLLFTSSICSPDRPGVDLVVALRLAAAGSRRVEVIGLGDKRQITATFAAALDGTFLPMQILYQGKTDRSHPNYAFPDGFDIFHTPNHWANEETCLRFFENIIFPYIEKVREEIGVPSQKAMVLMDNFSGQKTTSLLEKLEEKGIVVVMIPAGTTDRLQPLDVSTNKAAKDFMREKFRHWYAQEVEKQLQAGTAENDVKINMGMPVMKEVGVKWLTALYDKLRMETSIIINGFKNVGIVEAVEKARKGGLDDESAVSPEVDEDPFNGCSDAED